MSALIPWIGGTVWLVLYLGLVFVRERFEQWTIARLQGQQAASAIPGRTFTRPARWNLPAALAFAVAILTGAALPLTAGPVAGWLVLPSHALERVEGSLLLVLILHWIAVGILAVEHSSDHKEPGAAQRIEAASAVLVSALPALIALLGMSVAAGALAPLPGDGWSLTALLQVQGTWNGFHWMGVVQPIALIVWAASPVAPRPQSGPHARWARQAIALNQALLTTVLWFGGWQGPLAQARPALGLIYTLGKVGAITFVQIWAWASRPQSRLNAPSRAAWQVWTPLAVLNLLVTTWICVWSGRAR